MRTFRDGTIRADRLTFDTHMVMLDSTTMNVAVPGLVAGLHSRSPRSIGSALCAAARTADTLVLCRVLQGLGGEVVVPIGIVYT